MCRDIAAVIDRQIIGANASLSSAFFGPHERFVVSFLYHQHRGYYDRLMRTGNVKWAGSGVTNTAAFRNLFRNGQ